FRDSDEAREFLLVESAGAEEALVEVATPLSEQHELAGALDAFDDDREPQFAGKREDRPNDDAVALAGANLGNQPAVDLQRVQWQAAEIGKARITCSEIVESDLDARVADALQIGSDGLEVAEKRCLGDLDRDPFGIDADRPNFVEQPVDIAVLQD